MESLNSLDLAALPAANVTGHYLAELLPRVGAPGGTEHFVSAGRQLLPLTGHANLEPGDVIGIAAAPLLHIPLEACKTAPPAHQSAPATDGSVHCVDEPYFDLAPSHVHVVEPDRPTSDPPDEVLKRLSPESREKFLTAVEPTATALA